MSEHHAQFQQHQQAGQPQQQQQQSQQQQQQQLLTIKVMRLGKPMLQLNSDGKFLLKPDGEFYPQESDSIFKESLKIPSAFGSITAGEVLKCCVCVTNSSPVDMTNVTLRVEVHKYTSPSATQLVYKNVLLDTISQPVATLTCGGRIDHIVQHKVIESGYHHIVCTVRYTRHLTSTAGSTAGAAAAAGTTMAATAASTQQQMTLRKSYGFNVGQPMAIQTRVHYLYPKEGHKWLVEAQMVAKVPMFLDSFTMETNDACVCNPLTPEESDPCVPPSPESRFPAHLPRFKPLTKYFVPDSVVHRVFEVTLKQNCSVPPTLGFACVSWNGPFGSPNKMNVPIITPVDKTPTAAQAPLPVSLVLIQPEAPTALLYKPFALKCTFSNTGSEPISATISFAEGTASGISLADHVSQGSKALLEPKKNVSVSFNLVSLQPGLQNLGQVAITETGTGRKLDFKDLGSIVVL